MQQDVNRMDATLIFGNHHPVTFRNSELLRNSPRLLDIQQIREDVEKGKMIKLEKRRSLRETKGKVGYVWDNRTILTFLYAYKYKNSWGRSALRMYIETLNRKVKDVVNEQDESGNTLLNSAAKDHNTDLVRYLIDYGADVNKENNDGDTPLLMALKLIGRDLYDSVDLYNLVVYLVEHGADVNKGNNDGNTPLLEATNHRDRVLAQYLVEHGADVNKRNNRGESPLLKAIRKSNYVLINYLIEHGANVNEISSVDRNIPLVALMDSHDMYLQVTAADLIERSADVNRQFLLSVGLHKAAYLGNYDMVKYLVEHGADVNAEGSNGETVLQILRRRTREIEEYLISRGAH